MEPTVIAHLWLVEQGDGRWRCRAEGWGVAVRNMRVPQAAISLVVDKLRERNRATRTETTYSGSGSNYGQPGLYTCKLFREPQQPKGAE